MLRTTVLQCDIGPSSIIRRNENITTDLVSVYDLSPNDKVCWMMSQNHAQKYLDTVHQNYQTAVVYTVQTQTLGEVGHG